MQEPIEEPQEQAGERRLEMKYAGGLVRHLGLQMYAGAVPAIAELIANAWDADARNVWVDIPLGEQITDQSEIRVRDDGLGMSFEEANNRYLVVGRDRRAAGESRTPSDRRVMGRKGLGKLAGFGAAHLVEVWTVKGGRVTAFRMDYEQIVLDSDHDFVAAYEPAIIRDGPVSPDDPITEGTLIVLRRLQLRKAVNPGQFRTSMVRRFAVLSATFGVHINDEALEHEEMPFQFRFPEAGKETEDVTGGGPIRWWVGFTKEPIRDDDARGITVLARGKLAQAPFFFDLSGGAHGQHGMQYMTGEVEADFLDEVEDLIATDRASVLWEHPRAEPLLTWGQQKVKELLGKWADARALENERRLRDTKQYMQRLDRFPERERKELRSAILKLASIETIGDERLDELVDFLFRAYENETFMELIRQISATDESAQEELLKLFAEWDVLEAISVAQMVRGRIQVIRKFREMIEAKEPEKPNMQDYVKDKPWLLHPQWDMLEHERSLDKVLTERFDVEGDPDYDGGEGRKRLDFFCMADTAFAVVVELKRPGDTSGLKELGQLEGYVDYLTSREKENTDPHGLTRKVSGCLVYTKMLKGTEEKVDRLRRDGMYIVTWDKLLETTERLHREYLRIVKSRAPEDDPRVQQLGIDGDDGEETPAES